MVGLRKNFSRCRDAIYLGGVQRIIPNSRGSLEVSISGTSVNERTGQSDMENVAYNCTLTYGTCEVLGSVYSFFINVYDRSYLSGSTNQISNKQRRRADHAI